jgi:methyltransferase (TIGR00027 family)
MAIKHISDTARAVAHFRALESERADALFHDPFARRLAGPSGEQMALQLGSADLFARAIAVRTAIFDELILECVTARKVDFIVNLAAGLDSRPWRLALPQALRWVDVDLPNVLDYKRSVLQSEKPRCDYQALPADLTDADARVQIMRRLDNASECGLAITEGLLVYLRPEQVAALARELHRQRESLRYWVLDTVAPQPLQILQAIWEPVLRGGGIKFQFATADSLTFFQALGWREEEFRSSSDEARRLGRQAPLPWLARLLLWLGSPSRREEFRRLSGTALLERIRPSAEPS